MSTIAALAAGFALIYREQYNLGASLVILAFILSGGALIVLYRLIRYDPDLRRDPLDSKVGPIVRLGGDEAECYQPRILREDQITRELLSFAERPEITSLEIDVFACSGATPRIILGNFLDSLFQSSRRTSCSLRHLTVNVLLRDFTGHFIIPCGNDLAEDPSFRQEINNKYKTDKDKLIGSLIHYKAMLAAEDVNIVYSVRHYILEPFHKGFIIQKGERAFWGLYPIEAGLTAPFPTIWDYDGRNVSYCELRRHASDMEDEMLRSLSKWFNQVWEHLSRCM
jgi:hypothetical protein